MYIYIFSLPFYSPQPKLGKLLNAEAALYTKNYQVNPLNKRETMPGTGNLPNYSVLVKSQILKENLQPLIY